jgi:hypothetical protein
MPTAGSPCPFRRDPHATTVPGGSRRPDGRDPAQEQAPSHTKERSGTNLTLALMTEILVFALWRDP